MKNLHFILLLLFATHLTAQQFYTTNFNNVGARINVNGCFFTESTSNRAAYEVPKTIDGSGADVIYASSFSIGAQDQNNIIRVCANKFINDPKDFQTGPVAIDYSNSNYLSKNLRAYKINKVEIEQHQLNWNSPSYTIPNDILNWPGNGDIINGEAAILAPFVDYNSNDVYEPLLGDHPLIRGDQALFFMMNDHNGNHALTGGVNLNMEYHFMIYQYATNDQFNNMTFINLKVINRSQETYDQLIVSNFTDFDIGGSNDDYIGSSSSKNMIFGYNGTDLDNGSPGATGYGINPPTCGVKLLNHQSETIGYYNNNDSIIQSDPTTTADFWNYMTGHWPDGINFTAGGNGYGGTNPTHFLYDGNPNNTNLWTEVSTQNSPGDRRGFISSQPIDNFAPDDFICYDYAIIYSRTGGNNLLNVNGLFDTADDVQTFYDSQSDFYCLSSIVSLKEAENNKINIYPNPSRGEFRISLDGTFTIEIYDISGKLVSRKNSVSANQEFRSPEEAGIYMVKITRSGLSVIQKLIVE